MEKVFKLLIYILINFVFCFCLVENSNYNKLMMKFGLSFGWHTVSCIVAKNWIDFFFLKQL